MKDTDPKNKLISAVAAAILLSSEPKELDIIIEDLDCPDFVEVSDTLAQPPLEITRTPIKGKKRVLHRKWTFEQSPEIIMEGDITPLSLSMKSELQKEITL